MLLEHVGEILSRDEITNLVWHRRVIGNNSLPNAIHTLRIALGDENKQQRIIQTIPKMGYLLDPEFCEIIEENSEDQSDEKNNTFQEGHSTDSLAPPCQPRTKITTQYTPQMKSHHRQWNQKRRILLKSRLHFPYKKHPLKRSENVRHSAV